ncbi:hypothetical protein [Alloactinosynnema sp. L-07]|uniref:HNH endonuclease signature motif containing protein n=1 Tax=Alloactinosynnema sp. L-07 TaxID=1653480 RepID=UPI00065F0784|nr:HNH endonuclease signature motif containing protein [Alloactinosynnema sp. L-07]CRK62078.1 hypothetical protein [Alloactinosynnema sp. L-07]
MFTTDLAESDIATMGDVEVLDLLRQVERQRAALDPVAVRALARMAELRPDRDAGGHRFAGAEVGAALMWTPAQAATRVAVAARLVTRFPDTVRALAAGRIDLPKAAFLSEVTATLDDQQATTVEQWILDRTEHKTIERWRQALRAKKDRVDPDGADRRREQRRAERRVDFHPADDGMAHLDIYDTGERLRAIFLLTDRMARTARAQGAAQPLSALRADALFDLVFGVGTQNQITVELQVAVPYSVLLGANIGGVLDGYGPVPNIAIKELITDHGASWRRIITDPAGKVLEVSNRRHPGTDLARHVRLRDRTCRFTGCHRPAASCELDHTIQHSHGGTTDHNNLACLCPLHHKLKDQPGWSLHQPSPGRLVWTTPTGWQHTVTQDPLIDFDGPPRQSRTRAAPAALDPHPSDRHAMNLQRRPVSARETPNPP